VRGNSADREKWGSPSRPRASGFQRCGLGLTETAESQVRGANVVFWAGAGCRVAGRGDRL